MAAKEATVYIVDVGRSTGECHSGRTESDLDYAMSYVWDKLATTASASRKTLFVGVIGLRTDESDNHLVGDGFSGFENLSILKEVGPIQMSDLRHLQNVIRPSNTDNGDAISAVALAVDMLERGTQLKSGKPAKFIRNIVLVTDGYGAIEGDEKEALDIAKRINEWEMSLRVIGVDFDDADFGFKEEDKDITKGMNEKLLRSFTEKCDNSIFATAAEAIEYLKAPEVKTVRPIANYKGILTLGDVQKYPDTAIDIEVERYPKTKTAKPPSASQFVNRAPLASGSGDTEMLDAPLISDLSAVKNERNYTVLDATAPGGKRGVDRDELSKGFMYGSTVVPISEVEQNITELVTQASFTIIGFIPEHNCGRYLNMGESCITVAPNGNIKAKMALSSLIHALHEVESRAVARLVTKEGKHPQILLLAPLIEHNLEALVDVPLPFAEDVRVYRFAPLDKVISSTGEIITKHRFLPGDELKNAMSDFVDSMDLSTFGKDEEGEPKEYMTIEETFSPVLHRINKAIRTRATHPDQGVQPPLEVLVKWTKPPQELVDRSRPQLDKLVAVSGVNKVPPQAQSKRAAVAEVKPLSGLDVEELLGKPSELTKDNAIPKYKQWMRHNVEKDHEIVAAVKDMGRIIEEIITDSTGSLGYDSAVEHLRVCREKAVELINFNAYNNYIQEFKSRLMKGELGGDRRDFWLEVRKGKLGLIHQEEVENSDKTLDDAKYFLDPLTTALPSHLKS